MPSAVMLWLEGSASFLSRLFMWFGPMVKLGNRTFSRPSRGRARQLSDENFERFEKLWAAGSRRRRRAEASRRANILWPIVHFARPMIVRTAVLQLFSVGFQFLRLLLLQQILLLVEDVGVARSATRMAGCSRSRCSSRRLPLQPAPGLAAVQAECGCAPRSSGCFIARSST